MEIESINSFILEMRGQKVIVDADLARLYGVSTKRLNEQVRRNPVRFPGDFSFILPVGEKEEVVAKCDHLLKLKYSPSLPRAFTEYGAIMAASVLNSEAAVQMSIMVVRAFVTLRNGIAITGELTRRLDLLEAHLSKHDKAIAELVQTLRMLMHDTSVPEKRRIGFNVSHE